jgi:hypothetical protein
MNKIFSSLLLFSIVSLKPLYATCDKKLTAQLAEQRRFAATNLKLNLLKYPSALWIPELLKQQRFQSQNKTIYMYRRNSRIKAGNVFYSDSPPGFFLAESKSEDGSWIFRKILIGGDSKNNIEFLDLDSSTTQLKGTAVRIGTRDLQKHKLTINLMLPHTYMGDVIEIPTYEDGRLQFHKYVIAGTQNETLHKISYYVAVPFHGGLNAQGNLLDEALEIRLISPIQKSPYYVPLFIPRGSVFHDPSSYRSNLLTALNQNENVKGGVDGLLASTDFNQSNWDLSDLLSILKSRNVDRQYVILTSESREGAVYDVSSISNLTRFSQMEAWLEASNYNSDLILNEGRNARIVHLPSLLKRFNPIPTQVNLKDDLIDDKFPAYEL